MLQGAPGEARIGKPYTAEAMVTALGIVAERMAHAPARTVSRRASACSVPEALGA